MWDKQVIYQKDTDEADEFNSWQKAELKKIGVLVGMVVSLVVCIVLFNTL